MRRGERSCLWWFAIERRKRRSPARPASWRGCLRCLGPLDQTRGLLEELFVHFLDVQGFFDTAPNAMTNHQARELLAVD
jgi:hypothetical protein